MGTQLAWLFLLFVQGGIHLANQSWIVAVISIAIAAFGLGLGIAKHWGLVPRSRLGLEIADSMAQEQSKYDGLYSRGWIENPRVPVTPDEVVATTEDNAKRMLPVEERSRIPAYFARAKITNLGRFTANSITLSLTSIKRLTDGEAIVTTVQPLRWSDTWYFQADQSRNIVNATPGMLTFPVMPLGDHRYCDICFHYDLKGPTNLGRFLRRRVYFAVGNLPSQTYSLEEGVYEVTFNLVAENCNPVQVISQLHISFGIEEPRQRVRFEKISENRRKINLDNTSTKPQTKSAVAGQ
jgi:hypothetical protein